MSTYVPNRGKAKSALRDAIEASKLAAQPRAISPAATTSKSDLSRTPTKRKRDLPPGAAFSQPANSSFGEKVETQLNYAVEFLKGKDERMPVVEILTYLSLTRFSEEHQESLVNKMRAHPRIEFFPDPTVAEQTWKVGEYAHRPLIPGVKDKISLLKYLQQRNAAQGVHVKDLKDGWPKCEPALTELENEHKILVCRTKKDNVARQVFLDDSSLFHKLDPDYQKMWLTTPIPKPDELPRKLTAVGQRPTSDDPSLIKVAAPVKKGPKKRAMRKVGKATNEHMAALLRDNGRSLPGMPSAGDGK